MAKHLHFRDYEVDIEKRELRRAGDPGPIGLSRLMLDLLLLLVRSAGRVVSKDELAIRVWRRNVVSDAAVARAVADLRRVLGDDGRKQEIIKTVHGVGYSFVGEVDDFVGRRPSLAVLQEAVAHTRGGRGGVVLVSGEAGIGKTRLVEEACNRASADGVRVLWGHASEDEGAPALWPWPELLQTLAAERGTAAPLDASGRAPFEFEHTDSAAPHPSSVGARDPTTAAEARFRTFDEAVGVVRRASRRRPVAIVVEDLHWASSTAIALFEFMAAGLERERALLIGTYRSSGPRRSRDFQGALGRLKSRPRAHSIVLEGLAIDEVARVTWRASGLQPSAELARAIHARSAGNPLFVRELARELPRDPNWMAGNAGDLDRIPLPPSVRQIARVRLNRLPPALRNVARAVAVFGQPVTVAVLGEMVGMDGEALFSHLEEAELSGLLVPVDRLRWRFTHPLVRSGVYEGLSRSERMALHLAAANAIEAVYGSEARTHAAELALHLIEALPKADAQVAEKYCRWAAEEALSRGSFDEAAHHLDRALLSQEYANGVDAASRCDLLLALGEARLCNGDGEAAAAAVRRAADIAREQRDAERLARSALAMGAFAGLLLPMREIAALTEEAAQGLDDVDPLRLLLEAQLAALEQFGQREDRARARLADVLRAARQVDDVEVRCEVLVRHLQVLQAGVGGDPANRLPLADDILQQADRCDRPDLVLEARRHRISLLLELGDGAALDREIAAFDAGAARSRRFDMRHHAAAVLAMRALDRGAFDEARRRMEECTRLANQLDFTQSRFTPLTLRTLLPHDEASMASLLREVDEILEAHPEVVGWRAARMNVAAARGDREEASRTLAFFAQDRFESLGRDPNLLPVLCFCASAAAWLEDRPVAEALYEKLEPFAEYNLVLGWGVASYGPIAYYVGLLAGAVGRADDALEHFGTARKLAERLEARTWRVRTDVAEARLLVGTKRGSDERRGRDLAGATLATAIELGLAMDAVAAARVAGLWPG